MRTFIGLLLIFTFLVQPPLVLADAHQLHQSGNQHLTFEHEHPDGNIEVMFVDDSTLGSTLGNSIDTSFDCHHCCHCHGAACSIALPVVMHMNCDSGESIQITHYVTRSYPSIFEKQFRPPRV